jgi:glycosyltransferase involved in cell wall biosynthesis
VENILNELRILHRGPIYPDISGGSLRTLNIARIACDFFTDTTVYSMDKNLAYEGNIDGLHLIQEKISLTLAEKLLFYPHALFARELHVPFVKRAFLNPENVFFQIENDVLFPHLRKKRISRFIIDEQNVNWEMASFVRGIKNHFYQSLAFRRDKENEKDALRAATHVLCCSRRDRDIFCTSVPEVTDKISVIPNCVDLSKYNPGLPRSNGGDRISRILFIGTLSYPPNIDAVHLICRIIAPKSDPTLQFIIAGRNPPAVRCPGNVRFTGYVPDIVPVIADADICIAPLRSGSGTRLKILEYMAMEKPVIATSKGAEGIECQHGLNIIIEDSIEKYPGIIMALIDDPKRCRALGREARKLVEEKYDWELYRKPLGKIYRELAGH